MEKRTVGMSQVRWACELSLVLLMGGPGLAHTEWYRLCPVCSVQAALRASICLPLDGVAALQLQALAL